MNVHRQARVPHSKGIGPLKNYAIKQSNYLINTIFRLLEKYKLLFLCVNFLASRKRLDPNLASTIELIAWINRLIEKVASMTFPYCFFVLEVLAVKHVLG